MVHFRAANPGRERGGGIMLVGIGKVNERREMDGDRRGGENTGLCKDGLM